MEQASPQKEESTWKSRLEFFSLVVALPSAVLALISDLVTPLGFLSLYLAVAVVFAFLIGISLCVTPLNGYCKKVAGGFWFKRLGAALLGSAVLLLIGYVFSKSNEDQGGFLAANSGFFRGMQEDLSIIAAKQQEIADNTARTADNTAETALNTRVIADVIPELERETSDNPRKELANQGINWRPEIFLEYVELGDLGTVEMFLEGGMPIATGHNDGRPISIMLARNKHNAAAVLRLLVEYGFDPDMVFESGTSFGPQSTTTLMWAIELENDGLIEGLIETGANIDTVIESGGAMFSVNKGAPITLAAERGHFSAANILAQGGADVSADDYGAYRLALYQSKKAAMDGVALSSAYKQSLDLLKPRKGKDKKRIDTDVDQRFRQSTAGQRIKQLCDEKYTLNLKILQQTMRTDDTNDAYEQVIELDKQMSSIEAELKSLSAMPC